MTETDRKLYTSEFLLINILNFLTMTGNGVINVLYPLRLEDVGKNDSQVGYIMGTLALAGIASRLLMGPKIDKLGRTFFLRGGAGILILCTFLYSVPVYSDSYLLVVRIIHGFGWGAYFTAVFTWVADYAPKGRMAEAIGIFGISGLLPMAAGPLLGEYILKITNDNFLYLFPAGGLLITIGLIMSFWLKDINNYEKRGVKGGILKLLGRPGVFSVCLSAFVFGMGIGAVLTFMAPFTRVVHLGEVAPFFTAYTIGSIVMRLITGKTADKYGRQALIIPALLLMSVGQSFIQYIDNLTYLVIIGFSLGCAHGMIYPAMSALMMDRAGNENRGAGMGLFNASTDVGYFAGGLILGYVAFIKGFQVMFTVSSLIIMAGLILFGILECGNRKTGQPCHQEFIGDLSKSME